jgi:hypothetical protein
MVDHSLQKFTIIIAVGLFNESIRDGRTDRVWMRC